MQIVPIDRSDNPLYPLPRDYATLTAEGRRKARVNACRQWALPASTFPGDYRSQRSQLAEAAVASHLLFDVLYLHPDGRFQPGFYPSEPLPVPEMHLELLRAWSLYRFNTAVFPRGGGKTTLCTKDMIHRLITKPSYSFVYSTSTNDNAEKVSQDCKTQCYFNERIHADFSPEPEFNGRMRPSRGDAKTGIEFFYLENGSWLRVSSTGSRQRGARPRRYRLDDPEYDGVQSTSKALLRANLEHFLTHVVLPMIFQDDCGIDWTLTFVSKQHYGWQAMLENEDGSARHPRFRHWARMIQRARQTLPSGETVSCWPNKWPLNSTERDRLQLPRHILTLDDIETLLGTAAFNSEFMAAPGDADGMHWPDLTDPAHSARLSYTFTNVDEVLTSDPTRSDTLITWTRSGVDISMTLREFLATSHVFLTVDPAFTATETSDYKACVCMAYRPSHNELFVLDLWAARKKDSAFIRAIFEMADRWKARSVHVEVVRQGRAILDALQQLTNVRAQDEMGLKHVPAIRDIRIGTEAKGPRICGALDLRFEHGLIKLPLWKFTTSPWSMLKEQIEGFNPEAPNCGLANDDCIDAVALSSFVTRGRRREHLARQLSTHPVDVILNREDDRWRRHGISLGMGIDWGAATPEQISAILSRAQTPPSTSETVV